MFKGGEGINAGVGEVEWVISKDRYKRFQMQLAAAVFHPKTHQA